MKASRQHLTIAAIVGGAILLILAFRGGSPYVGTWTVDAARVGPALDQHLAAQGLPPLHLTVGGSPVQRFLGLDGATISIQGDGTYESVVKTPLGAQSMRGTWSASGNSITLVPSDPGTPPATGRLEGRILHVKGAHGGLFASTTHGMEIPYSR